MVVRHSQSGQAVAESVLLMVVIIGIMMLVINILKSSKFVEGLTFSPWDRISGMVECGVWQPCGVNLSNSTLHPSNRVISYDPHESDGSL